MKTRLCLVDNNVPGASNILYLGANQIVVVPVDYRISYTTV